MKQWSEVNPGYSILPYVRQIGRLVFETKAGSILDYGCGAAKQYRVEGIDRVWGIIPVLYDPNGIKYRERPKGRFDAVLVVDVLHYVQSDRLDQVLMHIGALTAMWAFVAIRCVPGDGMVTVRPEAWWREKLSRVLIGRRLILEVMDPR